MGGQRNEFMVLYKRTAGFQKSAAAAVVGSPTVGQRRLDWFVKEENDKRAAIPFIQAVKAV